MFTKGVPDSSGSIDGNTTWLEMKVLKRSETFFTRVAKDKLQFTHMQFLERGARAAYIIYWNERIYIIPPSFLARARPTNDEMLKVAFRDNSDFFFRSYTYSEFVIPVSVSKRDYKSILSLLRAK